ncbi:zinc ribbon domain-containing protein [Streptococcus caviae]|uniref:zinc ribbon domain-containing protein n=1 Tax=Streptococcus sp. 'caviae' TaxID=1915004 RepID=UPI00094BAA20|nr:hypothetical protein [Streptococcus sp. 'caviae']OLN84502.1 hypothetical protein BMI76_00015 [Streptococcus sp. 'caviae']
MASKEKWVELFEKVIGRKPTAQEFLEGKKADFDLKDIKKIAHVPLGTAESSEINSPAVPVENLNEAGKASAESEGEGTEKVHASKSPAAGAKKLPKQLWVQAFEKQFGRKPTPDEFLFAKSQHFDVAKISQSAETKPISQPAKPAEKSWSKGKKMLAALMILLLLALGAGYIYGNQYFSREAVAERYLKAANHSFTKALAFEVWSDTEKPIKKSELTYRNSEENRTLKMDDLMSDYRQLKNVGRKFLVFPDWRVAVKPVSATVSVNTKGLELFVNHKRIAKTDSDSYTKTLSRLYPGTYNFLAKGVISGQKLEVSSEETITNNVKVNLNVKYLSFQVNSNLTDGDLYVGSRKIGKLHDGKYKVSKLAVTDASKIYVQKSFPGKSPLKSETQSIEDIYDGDTVTLDADGVLDRDTADSLITEAYRKMSSYASSQTTPDDLDDVFTGGNNNKFYQDVKNTIDTNTTGAKNRSADSITFSDVDVTKVTQTGPTTFSVEFTVIYDFYYGYNSEHDSSGDIIQKLSWSALVEYVGDDKKDDSYSYSTYDDYRITSGNGKSSVLSTKNTVD